jgi:hypothetical protein
MQKLFTLTILCLLLCCFVNAKLITVSNNLNSPGQYDNLQTAVDAALTNDSLLVTRSPTSYGSLNINNKKLTLLGQGYDPRKDIAISSKIDNITLNAGTDGTTICGFVIGSINPASLVLNIVCKRNKIGNMYVNGNGYLITDNIIISWIYIYDISNTLIKNNIFLSTGQAIYGGTAPSNILITNNDFTYASTNSISVYNAVISNNIFYHKVNAAANTILFTDSHNCVVNNNITYNNTNTNPFNIGNNNQTGTGNKINVNPLYIAYDLADYNLTPNDNLQLQSSSPAKNDGTDGLDIGAYGGATPMQYPLSGEPAIPQIKSMNIINTVIPPTGTLNIQVKANSNN